MSAKKPHHDDTFAVLEHEIQRIKTKGADAVDDEDRKTLDEVFDKQAMLAIYKLMKEGLVDRIDFPISTGKEANVFRVISPEDEFLALKIYRTSNLTFKRISRYIEGDPRFKGIMTSRRKIVFAWASKEFRNLHKLMDAKVRVPEPVKFHQNMLLMEYIGTGEFPAPMLRQVELDDPGGTYKTVLRYMRLAYQKAGLVHGDLSEYNILMEDGEPVFIDVGQAFMVEHPNANEFLKRDIHNITAYFRSLDVKVKDEGEAYKQITKVASR